MNAKIKLITAGCVLLIALWRIVAWIAEEDAPASAFRHYEVLGQKAAELAAARVPPDSSSILLVIPSEEHRMLREQRKAFLKEIKRLGMDDVVILELSPGEWGRELGWRPGVANRVETIIPPSRVIVSFAGTPPVESLEGSSPTVADYFLVVLPSQKFLDEFMAAGVVDEAIVPATVASEPNLSLSSPPEEWFSAYFSLYKPTVLRNGQRPDTSSGRREPELQW